MITALLLPGLVGLVASLLAERLVRPGVQGPLRRSVATLALHVGLWCLGFAGLTLLVQRPWLAALVLITLELVVIQSSNAKWDSLREPFVVHDFEYFLDAIRYPRLYVPFFGIGLAVAATVAAVAAVSAFLVFEPALFARADAATGAAALASLALVGGGLIQLGRRALPTPSLEPCADLRSLGLVGHFWAYGARARQPQPLGPGNRAFAEPPPDLPRESLPDVLLVQNESFFDARRWSDMVHPDLLPEWDRLREEAAAHGRLAVPAWGANTARTEAAVLTGLGPEALDIDRFNPYRRLAREPVPNLARSLRELGYETVVVHPYPAGFYARDRVMATLGFERFIDIAAFPGGERDGQFISDRAVARRVHELINAPRSRPLFVFAITMENHGPTHLERADLQDPAFRQTLSDPDALPADCSELPIYLRHLANADRMIGACRMALEAGDRPGVLGWYGDHVPILPSAYRSVGPPDGQTDYAVWTTRPRGPVPAQSRDAGELGATLLNHVQREASGGDSTARRQGNAGDTTGHKEQA